MRRKERKNMGANQMCPEDTGMTGVKKKKRMVMCTEKGRCEATKGSMKRNMHGTAERRWYEETKKVWRKVEMDREAECGRI